MTARIEPISYEGYRALSLNTGHLGLIAPLDIGPRILSFGPAEGDNLLFTDPAQMGHSGEDQYRIRGGHRLWHAPEHVVRTYELDNEEVEYEVDEAAGTFRLTGRVEPRALMRKSLAVRAVDENTVRVSHTLEYTGLWPVETSAWALTVFRAGGTGVLSLPAKGKHSRDLLPSWHIVPWDYTDFSLPCWEFSPDAVLLHSDRVESAQKVGLADVAPVLAYAKDSWLFVKTVPGPVMAKARFPDRGCGTEVFSNGQILELETLSPLRTLQQGDCIEHVEYWHLAQWDGDARGIGASISHVIEHIWPLLHQR